MKYLIRGNSPTLEAISWRLQSEGETRVASLREDPKFILTDHIDTDPQWRGYHVIGSDLRLDFPGAVSSLGYDVAMTKPIVEVFRWRDRAGWGKQTLLGLPIRGMMNDNLGLPYRTGMASRYYAGHYDGLFEFEPLEKFLDTHTYSGFVILGLSKDLKVSYIRLGLGDFHIFAVLEGLETRLAKFLSQPESIRLKESWVTSMLVSRYPFPFEESSEQIHLDLNNRVLRHFYPYHLEKFDSSYYTTNTALGVSAAWGLSVEESSRRAIRTAQNLDVPLKQYRTDLHQEARRALASFLSIQDMSVDHQQKSEDAPQLSESST